MHATARSLGIDRLRLAERILLLEEIWDRMAAEPEAVEVPQWHKDDLHRRLAAYDADPHAGSSWEDVKRRLQKP